MKTTVFSLAVLLLGNGLAMGQSYVAPPVYESRAATAGESRARGMSDVVRSAGEYNLSTSAAAINMTEARKNDIQNRELWASTYFEMRRANRAYRNAERTPRMSEEARVRWAQASKPKPLSPGELDTVYGRISWPMLLADDQFSEPREQLNKAFAERAEAQTMTWKNYQRIEQACKEMQAELAKQIGSVSGPRYMDAKYFIDKLLYEAKKTEV